MDSLAELVIRLVRQLQNRHVGVTDESEHFSERHFDRIAFSPRLTNSLRELLPSELQNPSLDLEMPEATLLTGRFRLREQLDWDVVDQETNNNGVWLIASGPPVVAEARQVAERGHRLGKEAIEVRREADNIDIAARPIQPERKCSHHNGVKPPKDI